MYQLTIGKTQLKFETKEEGLTALLSRWYYERFPYRWYTDASGDLIIANDWIGDYLYRRKNAVPQIEASLEENGYAIFNGLKLEVID